ncbi:MAG: YigZ family protein [bacterium]|nr:YigZ family protein [bacterium]
MPILHEIRKQNLQNIAVIVARWFGGTKLGTGGLVRAYGECGALAIGNAVRVQRKTESSSPLTPFRLQSVVYQLAASSFAHVEQASSEGDARLLVKLRRAQAGRSASPCVIGQRARFGRFYRG